MSRFSFATDTELKNIVYQDESVRVALLTTRLIRVEKGKFTDLPTQTVWNRNLGEVAFVTENKGDNLIVKTDRVIFYVHKTKGKVEKILLEDGTIVTDFRKGNLLGTARTLDMVNGSTKLQPGILSRDGASVMDDSKSLLLEQDGTILSRLKCSDLYYFAYGHAYLEQLKDFFRLTGDVPLIPKFALGNWWSRYKAYTQEEYRSLMQEFIDREIPVTVATIDMDWHWVDVVEKFGKEAKAIKPKTFEEILYNLVLHGWTGYSWNTELFLDHKELLNWLHENGFYVPLNVHPSQGIRFFEDCYEAVCKRMGQDPKKGEVVPFDITDKKFVETYFDEVHHPLEEEGVDFWWLDWQQGKLTNVPGLDPLWALNHYHTLDSARDNKRPLILSRYAGLGSHRYPLGFSGDTFCTWKSLDFQPYFTNTAANAGYTWWSHDIGGHQQGIQDDELYLRWLQYGVFSPINRLHSTNSDFMGKEPWQRSWAVEKISEEFLRLRHRLIPYLYTANYRTYTKGEPICMPMYYAYDCEDAYEVKNQYIFGGQLLVCPITTPMDKRLNLSATKVWLPEGRWTDIFNDRIYEGGKWITMYRDLDSIPVLAPAGAIVPMYRNATRNDLSLEQPIEIHVWHGNGQYDWYEDDGETMDFTRGKYVITHLEAKLEDKVQRFILTPGADTAHVLPESRNIYVKFRDVVAADVYVDGYQTEYEKDGIWLALADKEIVIELKNMKLMKNKSFAENRISLLTRVQAGNNWKNRHFNPKRNNIPVYVQDALDELKELL